MKNISLNIQLFSSNISTSFKEGDYNAYGDLYSGYISISSNLSQSITTATSLKVNNVEYVGLETSFFSWADQIGGDIVEIPVFKNGNYNIKTIINEIEYDNVLSITQIKTENIPTRTLRKKNLTTILRGSIINSLDNKTDEMNAPSIAAVNEGLLQKYSTDETIIGRWVNGKNVYKKTYVFENIPKGISSKVIDLDNMEALVHAYGSWCDNVTGWQTIPCVTPDYPVEYGIGINNIRKNNVNFNVGTRRESQNLVCLTFEYTKTTD